MLAAKLHDDLGRDFAQCGSPGVVEAMSERRGHDRTPAAMRRVTASISQTLGVAAHSKTCAGLVKGQRALLQGRVRAPVQRSSGFE